MKRLLFTAFVASSAFACALAVAACDPDLTPTAVPAEGAAEAGPVTPSDGQAPVDGGPGAEGGPAEGGTEAGIVHTIDGTNDFTAGEKLKTTSAAYDAYVSWDDTNVYFGMAGADVAATSSSKWVLIYVDGSPGNAGSTAGITYDCTKTCLPQQARLPFAAGYHLRWKADGTYTNLQKWDGLAWANVGPISTAARKGTFMELSITRAALGKPPKLKVSMSMLIEESGAEWTYAGVPSNSFTDGPNPAAFTSFFDFDLADRVKAPNTYAPTQP